MIYPKWRLDCSPGLLAPKIDSYIQRNDLKVSDLKFHCVTRG